MFIAVLFASLWTSFANPAEKSRPWCYHLWKNGNVDRETITADLEAMKELGFGGINLSDSRGYWDTGDDHVKVPPVKYQWGTSEWYDMVEYEMRECARLGLTFTMNAACSGGTMSRIVNGKFVETDIKDKKAVFAHLDAAIGPLIKRCPELIGTTFTHIYSVSYEGNKAGGSWKVVKDAFYGAMVEWTAAHGLKVYSESGGPWDWGGQSAKLDCSQLDMLAHNDFPQGEFWPMRENGTCPESGHANTNARYFIRGPVLAARREGRKIVSMEAFTHMHRHWSVDPAFLKPTADMAFADGVNRIVWHTFTCSPKAFGVPGIEYFAGSHINRNVTWQKEAKDFVHYLWRCQSLLQQGEYVDDGEFLNIQTNYYGWGRFRKDDKAQFTTTHRHIGADDVFFVAGEGKGELTLNAKIDGRDVELWDAVSVTRHRAVAEEAGDKTKVLLDLPKGGSCFIVFTKNGCAEAETKVVKEYAVNGPWNVSFAYHAGVPANPPKPMVMETLKDFSEIEALQYFAGHATYRATFDLAKEDAERAQSICLGELPTGVAHVYVNEQDCGCVWCAPWQVPVVGKCKAGRNNLEIRYINNWHNRLVGDCRVPESERVTESYAMHYWTIPRQGTNDWAIKPRIWSGPSISDKLQHSGILGPIAIKIAEKMWPVMKTYSGEHLRKIKMPLGGIGTGTISLSGRGALVDWELAGRPNKGFSPRHNAYAPHFAIRCETADGTKVARLLEGPLLPDEYEGQTGCAVQNQGFPRFAKTVFKAAYPLAQIEYFDAAIPVNVRLEAMNPLVKGDAEASGIPAALFRWCVRNPTTKPIKLSIAGTIVDKISDVELALEIAPNAGDVTAVDEVREPGWNVGLDRYWKNFLEEGVVKASDPREPKSVPAHQRCVAITINPGEERSIPFVIGWRFAKRMAWERYASTNVADVVGNHYATKFATAKDAARYLLDNLLELERKTVDFVNGVLSVSAPDVVKEAALFNLSSLRSETCFRTADGHFYGWEGCYDKAGSCNGSCTHVWGYEHALVDIWPDLAKDMLETQFGRAQDAQTGLIVNRVNLPATGDSLKLEGHTLAAADGQMQCIIKAFEYWKKSHDIAWLKRLWPRVRMAIEFCWIENGWDGDRDGVMEGCQHNTMDVEYYGPNPQMEFLYLAALQASAEMARATGDAAFAEKCIALRKRGSAWTEANLFNGSYYEHKIIPPKGPIAEGLRHRNMGAADLSDPDYQLGAGCLIDQLLGDYSARAVGLEPVADDSHAKTTIATILEKCRREPDDSSFNPMRGYAMAGERSLRMAWYPKDRMPRSPFPYYRETMTGFEYVVAALQAMYGDKRGAEQTVRDIRDRYDGLKRNPFDEAECGHHYVRAMAAWTVLKAFSPNFMKGMTEK